MFGVDPRALAQIQDLCRDISGEITVDYKERTIALKLRPTNDQAIKGADYIMDQFPAAFAQQLSTFFGIRGKLVRKNAPPAVGS